MKVHISFAALAIAATAAVVASSAVSAQGGPGPGPGPGKQQCQGRHAGGPPAYDRAAEKTVTGRVAELLPQQIDQDRDGENRPTRSQETERQPDRERAESGRDQALPEPPPKRATGLPEEVQAMRPPSRCRTETPAQAEIRAAALADLAPERQ